MTISKRSRSNWVVLLVVVGSCGWGAFLASFRRLIKPYWLNSASELLRDSYGVINSVHETSGFFGVTAPPREAVVFFSLISSRQFGSSHTLKDVPLQNHGFGQLHPENSRSGAAAAAEAKPLKEKMDE